MKGNIRISQKDLFFAVTQTIIGVGVLSLPYSASQTAGSDGWITIFLTGIALHAVVLIIWLLNKRFPHQTLYDYSSIILGKPIGFFINLAYILYFSVLVAYIYILITDILVRWIFPETPKIVLLFLALSIFIYGCMGTIKNLISIFSVTFIFILGLCVISLFTIFDPVKDIRFLFPIGSSGLHNIVGGIADVIPSFIGYETLLIYLAFVTYPKRFSSIKGALLGVGFVTFYYVSTVLLSMMMFSQAEIAIIPEPVLYMLRSITVTIFQRWDLIFLSIWGAVVMVSFLSFGYLAAMGTSKTFRMKHPVAVIVASLVVSSFTLGMHYGMEEAHIEIIVRLLHLIFGIAIPTLLLGISIIFN